MDLENLCQQDGPLIKKMPTEDQFQKMVERLGISSDDDVVIYDTQGLYSAARAWFMFRVFNKNVKVHVMNGGLVRWTTEAYPLEKGKYELPSKKGSFALNPDYSLICSMNEVNQRVRDYKGGLTKRTVVDMRKPCCYHGTCHAPIANLPKGHIPGSVNIPYYNITDPYNNYMIRNPDELRTIFEKHGVMVNEPEKMIFR